ncbi:hypothetical protein BuS5_01028 [Desulfosarcina sp. BuS5]|uniref:DUF3313 domain-containing protein n=1 Tax=Desulfosarcina sp. BuS5 TaxID=933262 RepID=UPI00048281B4|nr:DUF3313 domain-containing protein [Desulfosarcina sp. BuS5]WDN88060.1 hypothetical protein BuS5_01028 [Desulfosarcina sp. BuS5]
MKRVFRFFKIAAILTAAIGLAGCMAGGMKDVEHSGFLKDYGQLEPGEDDRAVLTYFKPGVDFKSYTKLMFERVVVFLNPTAESRETDPTILKELADFYQNALLEAVKDGYEVVDQPGPDVLWVRVAITDVDPSNPIGNTLSSIIPVGIVAAGAVKMVSGENLGTGEAATEIEVLDSMTKERLVAAVDRRQGGKFLLRGKWTDTKQSLEYWAKRFRERLDELRGLQEQKKQ